MKKYLTWSLCSMLLTGCLPYPRFVHVYTTPQYTGLFVDRQRRPVPNVLVSFANDPRQFVQTGSDGRAVLQARRRFQAIKLIVMDPPRYQFLVTVRASWLDTIGHSRAEGMLQHEHQVHFTPDQREVTIIQDTVELPL